MFDYIAYVTRQIQSANRIPALITAAFVGLELTERAATVLLENAPEEAVDAYRSALTEATHAWWALSHAPSLAWPDDPDADYVAPHELAVALRDLVHVVTDALHGVAAQSIAQADRTACLIAASHAVRIHEALSRPNGLGSSSKESDA
ncbi:hypothetical protein ACGFNU_44165 [Spirillospora sp. NPDC048911]|uniref:hypothetical protein n=1 Tax=Spirillospora sp. NPDC048911 TaxID=3364527 RepID=UPI00371F53B3